jgi:hypothetical protein
MVYFAITRKGYDDLVATQGRAPSPLWVNGGVLTSLELSHLRDQGIDVSSFTARLDPGVQSAILEAIDTVRQHHAGQTIWVECTDGL